MDPLSITAATVGISQFAIYSIVELHNFIESLGEAGDVVQDIASNLEAIQRPLNALKNLEVSDESTYRATKSELDRAGLPDAVNKCGEACAKFETKLKVWTSHSSLKRLSLRDRLIIQLRSEGTLRTSREGMEGQIHALRDKIQQHMDLVKQQQDEAQTRMQELREEPEDEEDEGAQRLQATREVEERLRLLEANQASCLVVFSQLHSKLTGQEIGHVTTTDDSVAWVGMPESVVGKTNLRIGNVKTAKNSAAAVGIIRGDIDMRNFFSRRR
ncbi:hypothetical protein ABW21_db0208864 [Orbilia brochopaga]|nr:hypothetical protein ABW21_db0208864 [Drechslerella brochopaga]